MRERDRVMRDIKIECVATTSQCWPFLYLLALPPPPPTSLGAHKSASFVLM